MGLFFSFSKQRKPRGFRLQHRYYDEQKEKLEKLENTSLNDHLNRRKRIRRSWEKKRKNIKYETNKRVIILLSTFIILWLIFKLLPLLMTYSRFN